MDQIEVFSAQILEQKAVNEREQAKNKELESDLADHLELLSQERGASARWESDYQDAIRRLGLAEERIVQLDGEVGELRSTHETLHSAAAETERELADVQANARRLTEEFEEARQEAERQDQVRKKDRSLFELDLAKKEALLIELRESVADGQSQIQAATSRLRSAEGELDIARGEVRERNAELAELQTRSSSETNSLKERIEALERNLEASEQEMAVRIERVNRELEESRNTLAEERGARRALAEERSTLLEAETKLQSRIEQLSQEIQRLSEPSDRQLELEKEVLEQKAVIERNNVRIGGLEDELAELQNARHVLQTAAVERDRELSAIQANALHVSEELEQARREAAHTDQTLKEERSLFESELSKKEDIVVTLRQSIDDAQSQAQTTMSKLQSAEKDLDAARDQVRNRDVELENVRRASSGEAAALQERIEELTRDRSSSEQETAQRMEQVIRLNREAEESRSLLAREREARQSLADECRDLLGQRDELEERCEHLSHDDQRLSHATNRQLELEQEVVEQQTIIEREKSRIGELEEQLAQHLELLGHALDASVRRKYRFRDVRRRLDFADGRVVLLESEVTELRNAQNLLQGTTVERDRELSDFQSETFRLREELERARHDAAQQELARKEDRSLFEEKLAKNEGLLVELRESIDEAQSQPRISTSRLPSAESDLDEGQGEIRERNAELERSRADSLDDPADVEDFPPGTELAFAVGLYADGRFDESEEFCLSGLQKDPNQPELLMVLGANRLQRGGAQEAIEAFSECAKSHRPRLEQRVLCYREIGMIYDELGKRRESKRAFQEALSLDVELAKQVVDDSPETSKTFGVMGAVFYRTGRYEQALEMLDRSVEGDGEGGWPRDWLVEAMCMWRLGNVEEARKKAGKATRWMNESLSGDQPIGPDGEPLSWEDCTELLLLRREAQDLISSAQTSEP
jgi:centromere protein F